jgi:hypothetical protein
MNVLRLATLALLAQAAASAQAPRTASLQGIVATVANEPIPRAAVDLRSLDAGQPRIYTSTTDRDGTFTFRNVPPGRYQLTAMRGGYVRGDFGVQGPGGSGITVTLSAGQRLTDVRLAMRATGTIAGRITDQHGDGVGNVHVKALRYAYQDGRVSLINVKSVFTNDLGEYRLGWLPPGLYNVSALHADAIVNTLNLPETTNSATSFASTAVTNAGGMNGGSFSSSGDRDPAVRARLGLAAGEEYLPVYYPGTVDHRGASVIDVRSGTETNAIDMTVMPARLGAISGAVRLLQSSAPSTRFQVQISRNPSYTARTTSVAVDATGSFSISGLAPGSYVVTSSFGSSEKNGIGYAVVDVAEGATSAVQLILEPGIRIQGRVLVEGRGAVPMSSVRVSLRTDPLVPGIAETTPIAPSGDGSLSLPAVVSGEHIVSVVPFMTLPGATPYMPPPAVPGPPSAVVTVAGPPVGYVKAIRYGGADVLNGRMRVDSGMPDTPLEIVIGTNPGQLDGGVFDAAQRPAGHVTVVLAPGREQSDRFDLYRVTKTDVAGRFRLLNLPPGDYRVFAWEDVETGAWLDPRFLSVEELRSQPVRIAEGDRLAVSVGVIPAR